MKPSQAPPLHPFEEAVPDTRVDGSKFNRIVRHAGATLWDYYAAHALCGLLASADFAEDFEDAKYAAKYADALLAERARREKEGA